MLELLDILLKREGFEVVTVEDGLAAMQEIERQMPDLAMLDYNMPRMSGLQAVREIRRRLNSLTLPVLLVTSASEQQMRVTCLEAGANDFLTKPFASVELLARVRSLLSLVDAKRALDHERTRQQARVGLLLTGATLLAERADLARLCAELDQHLERFMGVRMASVLELNAPTGMLRQVYPPGAAIAVEEVSEMLDHVLRQWSGQVRATQLDGDSERTPPEGWLGSHAEGEPGFLAAISHEAGDLWFPIRASGRLLGVAGFVRHGEQGQAALADPGIRPVLAAISRLLGLATETRELWEREGARLAQETEMHSATMAQERVLRDHIPALAMLDTAAVTLPARATGGDYFCYFLFNDGTQGAFLADIVGKGLTAAMQTMILNTLVREHGPLSSGPADLLERLNAVLFGSLEWVHEDPIPCTAVRLGTAASPSEARAGGLGLEAPASRLGWTEAPSRLSSVLESLGPRVSPAAIECVNAGHENPIVLRDGTSPTLVSLGRSFPLGWLAVPRLATAVFELQPGESLCLYTDGLLDILAGPDRDIAAPDVDRIAAFLALPSSPLAALALRRGVEQIVRGPALPDDVTIILINRNDALLSGAVARFAAPGRLELITRSTPAALSPVRQAAVAFLQEAGVSEEEAFVIAAVLVEIHTNSIVHGFKGRTDQPVRIELAGTAEEITLEVEEFHCGSFRAPAFSTDPALRTDGGMGLVLAKRVMHKVEWVYTERISLRLQMRWRPGRSAPGPQESENP